TLYGIECMLLLPLPDRLGVLWIGKAGLEPFSRDQTSRFEALVPRIADAIRQPEPHDVKLTRLARLDAIDQILPLVASALDVRGIFHRISEVARSVLPHDGATILLLEEDDPAYARLYALDGIDRESVPEIFPTNYGAVFN